MTPTLVSTIGPAGAGKTTWRRTCIPAGATVVSLDETRARLAPCGCSANQDVNEEAAEAGFATTAAVLAGGGTVVWDVTGYLARFRVRLLNLAAQHGAGTVGVVLLPPLLTVLARNARRCNTPCPECGYTRRVPDARVWEMHHAVATALPRLHTEGWTQLHFLALPHYLRAR
ncbi:AAA family ATPase [Amycolatopsis panacis]|uniref:Uncharacterized protein n=1 Tax=Amycolatopsis panacis TaxID=2340917 RepID=A0A419I3J5_9PSEU|nr:AAA family ATPase [Amycolatopsis panacis]RJQ84745.1 hypothetical protein D5S19_15890 [Amycolatopsis panacis]